MPRSDYTTPCPLSSSLTQRHDWQADALASDWRIMRYNCKCGARAWRLREMRAKEVDTRIRQYKAGGKALKASARIRPPTVTAKPRSVGTNAGGGYLPPGSGGRR
jgi:hypothetical protein